MKMVGDGVGRLLEFLGAEEQGSFLWNLIDASGPSCQSPTIYANNTLL